MIGGMRHRISIYRTVDLRDQGAGKTQALTLFRTVWGSVGTPSSYLRMIGGGEKTDDKKTITIRFDSQVTDDMQIEIDGDGKKFRIKELIDKDQSKRFLAITAERIG